jgi:type II restriction enzyme
MKRNELIDLIFKVAKEQDAFDLLEKHLSNLSSTQLKGSLIETGVLPELFAHDSSEEKLWAKYSDILLCKAFNSLGIHSQVVRTRGNSADVIGQSKNYTIVGDAKTFRLSRSAKNQKDFKIKALDDWRRTNDYAVLVGPRNQYPTNASQIYTQAIERNVTLLSYVHLKFMLKYYDGSQKLTPIWQTGLRLKKQSPVTKQSDAVIYWKEIDNIVCEVFQKTTNSLVPYKEEEKEITYRLGSEGIKYWEDKIAEYYLLSKEEAIKRLIRADKIEQKIEQIRKAMERECTL